MILILYSEAQEVCVKPKEREKTIFSEVDLPCVYNVDFEKGFNIGAKVTFMQGLFSTYLPISVVEDAVNRLGDLHRRLHVPTEAAAEVEGEVAFPAPGVQLEETCKMKE